jgi:hypothetical protein
MSPSSAKPALPQPQSAPIATRRRRFGGRATRGHEPAANISEDPDAVLRRRLCQYATELLQRGFRTAYHNGAHGDGGSWVSRRSNRRPLVPSPATDLLPTRGPRPPRRDVYPLRQLRAALDTNLKVPSRTAGGVDPQHLSEEFAFGPDQPTVAAPNASCEGLIILPSTPPAAFAQASRTSLMPL